MNQDFNNLNQNYNNTFNSQPQQAQNYQQPVYPTIQPMNSFENGNNNNQSFNSKPPKKMNLGLIIGIIAVVAVGVGIIIFNFLNDGNSNNSINSNNNTQNNKGIEKLVNDNENIITTSYVDSYNKFVIEYPTFYFDGDSSAMRVTSYVNKPIVEIVTILGKIYITYPSEKDYNDNHSTAKDFYENYFSLQTSDYCSFSKYLVSSASPCSSYSLKDSKNTGSYEFNNLNWERYEIKFVSDTSKKEYELWITVKNSVPYMVIFDASNNIENSFDNIDKVSDNLMEEILDNRKSIMEYIIKNIKFVDDKEELFAYKEASVLLCEGGWETSGIHKPNFTSLDKSILVPNCRTNLTGFRNVYDGKIINNDNNIRIEDVYLTLKNSLTNDKVFQEHFFVEKEEESYKLNNSTMGDYEIKKYVLVQEKYDWDRKYSVYVFKNNEFYGYIYNEKYDDDDSNLNSRILNNELDFAVKNLRLLDAETPRYWQYEEIK